MKSLQQWIAEQKEIEGKATPGPWYYHNQSSTFRTKSIKDESDKGVDEYYECGKEVISHSESLSVTDDDADLVCESRNNYRNVLEALEITLGLLDTLQFKHHIPLIKSKLGVTE